MTTDSSNNVDELLSYLGPNPEEFTDNLTMDDLCFCASNWNQCLIHQPDFLGQVLNVTSDLISNNYNNNVPDNSFTASNFENLIPENTLVYNVNSNGILVPDSRFSLFNNFSSVTSDYLSFPQNDFENSISNNLIYDTTTVPSNYLFSHVNSNTSFVPHSRIPNIVSSNYHVSSINSNTSFPPQNGFSDSLTDSFSFPNTVSSNYLVNSVNSNTRFPPQYGFTNTITDSFLNNHSFNTTAVASDYHVSNEDSNKILPTSFLPIKSSVSADYLESSVNSNTSFPLSPSGPGFTDSFLNSSNTTAVASDYHVSNVDSNKILPTSFLPSSVNSNTSFSPQYGFTNTITESFLNNHSSNTTAVASNYHINVDSNKILPISSLPIKSSVSADYRYLESSVNSNNSFPPQYGFTNTITDSFLNNHSSNTTAVASDYPVSNEDSNKILPSSLPIKSSVPSSGFNPVQRFCYRGTKPFPHQLSSCEYSNTGPNLVPIRVRCDAFCVNKEDDICNALKVRPLVDFVVKNLDGSEILYISKTVTEAAALTEMKILNGLEYNGSPLTATVFN